MPFRSGFRTGKGFRGRKTNKRRPGLTWGSSGKYKRVKTGSTTFGAKRRRFTRRPLSRRPAFRRGINYTSLTRRLTTSWSHNTYHGEWRSEYLGENNNKAFAFDNPGAPAILDTSAGTGHFIGTSASFNINPVIQVGSLYGTLAPVRDFDYHNFPVGEKYYYICTRIKLTIFNVGESAIRGRCGFVRSKNGNRQMLNDINEYLRDYPFGSIDSFNKNDFVYWGTKYFKFDNTTTTSGLRDLYWTLQHRKLYRTSDGQKANVATDWNVDLAKIKGIFYVQIQDPNIADANIVKFSITFKNYWIEGYNG